MGYKYTTLNSEKSDKIALSSDFLGFLASTTFEHVAFSDTSVTRGKWYLEVLAEETNLSIGIVHDNFEKGNISLDSVTAKGFFINGAGKIYGGGLNTYASGANIGITLLNKTVGIEIDIDNGSISYIIDDVYYNTYTNLSFKGEVYFFFGKGSSASKGRVNFGQTPFKYRLKEGFKAFGVKVYGNLLKNPTTNQYYSLADKTLILLPDASDETMINYGIEVGKEIQLDVDFDKIQGSSKDFTIINNNKLFTIPLTNNRIKKIKIKDNY